MASKKTKSLFLSLDLLYMLFKQFDKRKSEKFEAEWEKQKPRLLKAIEEGDIETIGKIASLFSDI